MSKTSARSRDNPSFIKWVKSHSEGRNEEKAKI